MLSEYLTRALRDAFPDVPFIFAESPEPVAKLEGPCAEMSPLWICDDGDEATVYLGTVTHGHLGCWDESLSTEERYQRITEDVVEFIRDLFADRIVGMSTLGGSVGGWRRLKTGEALPDRSRWKRQYVWSRALQ